MDGISSAAQGLRLAFARFDRSSQALLESVTGVSEQDPSQAVVSQIEAKTETQANVRTLNIADAMFQELLAMQEEPRR